MKRIIVKPMLGFLFMVLLGLYSVAQEKGNQITIKITKEVDGELQTFEKSYVSEEEMKADAGLKEFMGEDGRMHFSFPRDRPFIIDMDRHGEGRAPFMFEFDEDMAKGFQMIHPDSLLKGFPPDRLRDLGEFHENRALAFSFGLGNEDFVVADSLMRLHMKKYGDPDREMTVFVVKQIKISEEVGEEFGKKGQVKEDNLLELEQLSYYPNPAPNGRFKLKFRTPGEGELSIKIYNLEGKEIFNRYFERYGGLYSEMIDLSGQTEGLYLLEIQLDEKRLTRKIVIDE